MKVICIRVKDGLTTLVKEERDIPKIEDNQVRVSWHASTLNFHDYLIANGAIKVASGRIPMSDGAGEIIEVGPKVLDLNVGDKVMSMFFPAWQDGEAQFEKILGITGESIDGCMLEESCIAADAVTKIPEGYSYTEAACLPTAALTAWNALICNGNLNKGQKVLIEGTGGVSIFAMQIAHALGAEVYATSASNEKAVRLKEMGVKAVVNYKEDALWGKTIFKLAVSGVDHVIDVGGGSTMKQSIEASNIGAHIHAIGILGDGRKGNITFPKLFFKFIKMHGLAVGSRKMQNEMVEAINKSGIKPIIDKTFSFDQLAEAFEYQAQGKHFGKIAIEW